MERKGEGVLGVAAGLEQHTTLAHVVQGGRCCAAGAGFATVQTRMARDLTELKEVLSDFGLTTDDFRRMAETPLREEPGGNV